MRQAKAWIGRKYVWLAAVLLLLMAVCVSAAAETYPFTSVATVKVNMRRSASSTAALVDRIPQGASVTVVGSKGNYYKVQYNGQSGYVMKEFISTAAGDVATPTPVVPPTATGYPYDTVTTASVNLRARQSVNSDKLATIPKGATITVHKVSGTFAQVTYNGQDGYVKTDYIQLKTIVKATATPSPTPVIVTVAPEENASGYQVLMQGSTGAQVKALQQALTELGFLSGTADGIFGKGTQNAVVAFQSANSYPATGIVDANLQAFLYSGKPKNAKGVKTEVKTLAPVDGVTIRLNDQGDLVGTVQTRLQELGYYTGEISCVYDKTTQSAVKTFQKKNGLTADGICGAETQNKLLGAYALSANATATPKPTATPTPAPTFQVPSATVRQGDSGENVKLVQKRLKDLGYYTGTVDGKFGSGSVAALKTFQTKHGLDADGVAGSGTYELLFSYSALAFNQKATATPAPIPTPAATPVTSYPPITQDNVVKISLGVTDPQVTRLQNRLTQLGYYTANPDGTCKADDVAAIKAFQKKNGLTADGIAGYNTQIKLYSQSAITYSGAIAGGTVEAFTTLKKGDSGDAVAAMQQRLIDLGYLTGTADGKFGTKTAEAVYAFQKANGLVRDAKAGTQTLSLLYSATVSGAATPTPAPTSAISLATSQTLRKGDVSDAVVLMQQRLISLGYLAGKADGNFGVLTYKALQEFQKANGLTVDGIAGKQTLTALSSANAASSGSVTNPLPTATPGLSNSTSRLTAANVVYTNWYSSVRAQAKIYQYATVYDFSTGISWQVHMFSFGNHAEVEPLTAADTAKMEKAFGGNTWNPKAVWVLFGDGTVYMASTHSMPHEVQHITDNNFAGHACIHFPRTDAQVAAIGSYATSHQKCLDAGWKLTQSMVK
ncbi:MAG: peptidoglycan-binding protein [Eubacteriales bacterium]|nr:peptidoglycan-binding protein [Eubacteriales bacterium]